MTMLNLDGVLVIYEGPKHRLRSQHHPDWLPALELSERARPESRVLGNIWPNALGDLYVHLVDVRGDARESLERARGLPAFRQISEDLKPYISAYDPSTWRSPHDAVAQQFYHWDAEG